MIGTGYVGLVSGACFADFGHDVTCVDKDRPRSTGCNAGRMPIWEPGLEALVKHNAERGRLKFTTDLAEGIATPTRCSSRSARRPGAATAMPT
jgi:UDPglucose 6-dehydrogenase